MNSLKILDTTNLQLWYPFQEGSGTSATDRSGKGNTGTHTGSTYVDGNIGKALEFNGTTGHSKCALSTGMKSQNVTMLAWIKIDASASGALTIMAPLPRGANADGRGLTLQFSVTTMKLYSLKGDALGPWVALVANSTLEAGRYYMVGVRHVSGVGIDLFINGAKDATLSTTTSIQWADAGSGYPSPGQMYVGASKSNVFGGGSTVPDQAFFKGIISHPMYYSAALSDAAISYLYHSKKHQFGG